MLNETRHFHCFCAAGAGAGAEASQGLVAAAPQPLLVAHSAQRSASGTSFSAAAMCWPQPFHVGFLQSGQLIFMHMLVAKREARRGGEDARVCVSAPQAGQPEGRPAGGPAWVIVPRGGGHCELPSMSQRAQVLASYRALLRAARALPTLNRRLYVQKRARAEYVAARSETDPEKIAFLLQFAAVSLDNVESQARTLKAGALFAPWAE